MGKLLKLVAGLVVLVVLLLVVAVVVLPLVVDPNDYKKEIVSQVQEHTGRTMTMPGDLTLTVFPWLGVETGKITISNPKGFGGQPFAQVNKAAVRVKVMPLLSSKVEVDTLSLDGLILNLMKNKKGRTNWDDLSGGGAPTKGGDKAAASDAQGAPQFTIGGVDISNAKISWADKSVGKAYTVDQFFLKSGSISNGKPVSLELGLTFDSEAPKVSSVIKADATIALNEQAGTLDISDFQLNVDSEGDSLPGGKMAISLETALTMMLDGSAVTLDGLKLAAGDLQLSGRLEGKALAKSPAFSGNLTLAELNLRQWLEGLSLALPPMADDSTLTRVGGQFTLASKGAVTQVSSLDLVLDDSKITGQGQVQGSAVGFSLGIDSINMDRYLAPQAEEAAGGQKDAASGGAPANADDAPLMPVELLRTLNLNGEVTIGALTIKKLKAEQVKVKVKAKGGKISLDQTIGKIYQGTHKGRIDLNVSGKTPLLKVDQHLMGVEAGPLLKDLTGEDRLAGKAQFNATITSSGNSVAAIKQALGGALDFRFENGALKGVNLAQTIRETKAKFGGDPAPKGDVPQQTDFSELTGSGTIKRGVLTNRDLLAMSPYLRVTGAGTVNLVSETLDYMVKTVIVSTSKGQGGQGMEDLAGVPIPVKLTGPYASPNYAVDWGQVLTGTQKAKLDEKKAEVKVKLEEKKVEVKKKVEDKLKNKLKGLFN